MIVDQIDALLRYYHCTRGIGHTQVLQDGLARHRAIVLAERAGYANRLLPTSNPLIRHTALGVCNTDLSIVLRGQNLPLAVDNSAIVVLLDGALTAIATLQQENDRLRMSGRLAAKSTVVDVRSVPTPSLLFADVAEVCRIMQEEAS